MLEIKELRLQAIGRFVEEQVILFDKLGNLVQVDGVRNDTGGSSGSGKSTVFNSLDFLFGLNDIPSSVLQSRFTKEGISVTIVGSFDGKPLTITRGKGKLSVNLDGDITTGSKLAEEKIDQILGMPRKLFRPLLHKRQKEGGFFLQFTPKEIHEFLTDALGLSEVRAKAELVDKKIKEIELSLGQTNTLLSNCQAGLTATENAVLALGTAPQKEVDQGTVLALKKAYEAAQEAFLPLKAKQVDEIRANELTKPIPKTVNADLTALHALEAKLSGISRKTEEIVAQNASDVREERARAGRVQASIQAKKVEKAKLDYNIKVGADAHAQARTLAEEIKKIRESICPTCEQGWATDAAKAREAELLLKVKVLGDAMALAKKSAQEQQQLSLEISQLEPQAIEASIPMPSEYAVHRIGMDEINTRINEERRRIRETETAEHQVNRALIEQFGQSQRQLMERHQAELQQVAGQVDITRRIFEASAQKLKSYEEARIRYETGVKALADQKAQHEASIATYSSVAASLESDRLLTEELKRAVKGYTSCAFDEALEYIGTAATEIIRAIPNMANATIQLEGIRETKDGKVKEEVNAVINMDGEIAIPIKSLSGGERSSVDLAVDLAVIDLLENRTNKGINIFILDEPFTGLDTVSIEMAIEKLRSLNKRLIIVDHNPEIKQMVESRLIVVRDGLTSTIVQN